MSAENSNDKTGQLAETHSNHLSLEGMHGSVEVPHHRAGFWKQWRAFVGPAILISVNHNDAGSGYHAEFANFMSIGHAVIGPLAYHVEFFSSVSTERNSDWIGTFDTWLTCQVNKNIVLDGGVYIGLTRAADNWHPWAGMTWRY